MTAANNALIGIVNSVPESWNLLIDATESVVGGTVKEDLSSIGSAVSSSFNKDITNIKKDPWGWTKEAGQYMLSPEAFEIYVTAVGGAKIVKANPFKSPPPSEWICNPLRYLFLDLQSRKSPLPYC